MSAPGLSIVTN